MSSALRSDATALAAVAALLGPRAEHGPAHRHVVLPSPSRPRYVLPASGAHSRGAHIRPSGAGWRDRITRAAIAPALRVGAGRIWPGALPIADGDERDPSLRRRLAAELDRPDIELAVALGAPRPNRKPVVQVLGRDGHTVAWVKVGVDDHTDALVAHETAALTERRPSPPVRTPEVLAAGDWRGHPYLALAHMELTETLDDLVVTADAARAIAGPTTDEAVTESRWWRALHEAPDPDGAMARLLAATRADLEGAVWPFGAWHGDLAPWNATWDGAELTAWDWERSSAPVPLGLDLIHNRVQVAVLRDGLELAAACAVAAERDGPILRDLGFTGADAGRLVTAYLLELRARYTGDAVFGPLGPGAPIAAAIDADPLLGRRAPTP